MQSINKKVPGLIALLASVVAPCASAGGQLAGVADPSISHTVPLRYEGFLPVMPVASASGSPADNWKQANRTVASYDSMALTMPVESAPSAGTSQQSPGAPATDLAPPTNPHAGHSMPAVPASAPHAGHTMPVPTVEKVSPAPAEAETRDPHAGYKMPVKQAANPHAGHAMAPENPPDPHAGHIAPTAAPDPHSGHVGKEKK